MLGRRHRPVARWTKLIAAVPVGPALAVGERVADGEERLKIADRTCQIPVRMPFVRGLMIMALAEIVADCLPGRLAAFPEIVAARRIEHRHAHLGEAEMV